MVDAPLGLQPVWNVIYPLLPAATKRKVKFLSASNAVAAVQEPVSALSLSRRGVVEWLLPTPQPEQTMPPP